MYSPLLNTKNDPEGVELYPSSISPPSSSSSSSNVVVRPTMVVEGCDHAATTRRPLLKSISQLNAEQQSNYTASELERSRYDGCGLLQEERAGKLRADMEAKKEAQRIRERVAEGNVYDNPDQFDVAVAVPIGTQSGTTAADPKPLHSSQSSSSQSSSSSSAGGYQVQEYEVSSYDVAEYKSVYDT
jgi:hypothetical protein